MKLRLDPFLLGMVAAVALAWLAPGPGARGGWLHPEVLNQAGITLIFFLHGAALPLAALKAGTVKWRVHLLIQGFTFGAFPLLGLALWWAGGSWVQADLKLGVFFLCALPSTVSSSVALTAAARGDVAVAVFNATLSSLLGIVLTPLWLGAVLGTTGYPLPLGEVILDLVRWLLAPFALGQLLRPVIGAWIAKHKRRISTIDRGTILILVYTSFCDSFANGIWAGQSVLAVVGIVVLSFFIYSVLMLLVNGVGRRLGLGPADRIAAMFCGSKKSLATGVPMAQVIFGGQPGLGVILLPIMLYHALQLVLSGALASRWAARPPDPVDGEGLGGR